mmetsp:Transcript_3872/g.7827  ORF Transcript_3872/g.7827 Transcript_3872/m.7827 type:complete len:120 (+) Transcript_3872:137-496(+)
MLEIAQICTAMRSGPSYYPIDAVNSGEFSCCIRQMKENKKRTVCGDSQRGETRLLGGARIQAKKKITRAAGPLEAYSPLLCYPLNVRPGFAQSIQETTLGHIYPPHHLTPPKILFEELR